MNLMRSGTWYGFVDNVFERIDEGRSPHQLVTESGLSRRADESEVEVGIADHFKIGGSGFLTILFTFIFIYVVYWISASE